VSEMLRIKDPSVIAFAIRPKSARVVVWIFILQACISPLCAAELKPETVQAWDQYLKWANAKVQRELSQPKLFLIQNTLPPAEKTAVQRQLEAGQIIARRMNSVVPAGTNFEVPSGEIHHWWGAILLRNVTLSRLLQFLQDYDHHAGRFSDVERSRLISREGNHYQVFFRLKRSKSLVTAYYNTEQECFYTFHDSNRVASQSVATKIVELNNPGTADESERPPGNDRGFLWRLVSWWRFEQKGNDIVVELESASLSRDIPVLVKFIPGVSAYIRRTPQETLESVLASIVEYLKK
jgi:hypothetical protein